MPEMKKNCPCCGSALGMHAEICDICGEDVTAQPEPVVSVQTEAPIPAARPNASSQKPVFCVSCGAGNVQGDSFCHTCGAKLRKVQAQRSGKKAPQKTSASAISFSTKQWIVICVASFVLGAVITAAFFPKGTVGTASNDATAPAEGQAQDPNRPTLAQVNAAREAAEANPSDMPAQLRYANVLHDVMMLDQAIAQYKLYLASVPDNVDARVDLGICYFEQQKYAEAIVEMETAVKANPRHQLGNYNLGIVNHNAGNTAKAIEWLTKARDIDPTTPYGQNADRILKNGFGTASE